MQASRLARLVPASAIASRAAATAEATMVRFAPIRPRAPLRPDVFGLRRWSWLRRPEVETLERDLVACRQRPAYGLEARTDRGASADEEEVRERPEDEADEREDLRHRSGASPQCQPGRRIGMADELDIGDLADHHLRREDLAAAQQVAADAGAGGIGEGGVRVQERAVVAKADVAGEADDLMVPLGRQLGVATVVLLVVGVGGATDGTDDGHLCRQDALLRAEALDLADEVAPCLEATDEAAARLELLESGWHGSAPYSKCLRLGTI